MFNVVTTRLQVRVMLPFRNKVLFIGHFKIYLTFSYCGRKWIALVGIHYVLNGRVFCIPCESKPFPFSYFFSRLSSSCSKQGTGYNQPTRVAFELWLIHGEVYKYVGSALFPISTLSLKSNHSYL